MEFTLVFPFFLILLFAVIEFAFALNALLSIDYASRQAALAAAEGGNQLGADCSILRTVEESVQTPADASRITNVVIFKANANGVALGPQVTYTRSASAAKPCPLPNGTPATLPYSFGGGSYTELTRCNVLAGCGSRTVDTIGVEMTYVYRWHTPLPSLWPTGGTGYTMTKGNSMRMEPVL